MDAIIMPATHSLLSRLTIDFPDFAFKSSDEFRWSPSEQTIYYDLAADDTGTLLHELSHAILEHSEYARDISLIELEREAWDYAISTLAPTYAVAITDNIVQDSLDTYRDWLHARSTCPACGATGLQIKQSSYKCIACGVRWRVNDARFCGLKRVIQK